MSNKTISLAALTSITSATGRLATEEIKVEGLDKPQKRTYGVLNLETGDGKIELRLSEFDGIYKGFVNVWPAISGIKSQINEANRDETKATKDLIKAEKEAALKAEKEAAAKKRDEDKAKVKAEKEAAAKKAKEDREAAAKKALEEKKKADAAKAKKAADAKAKKDAANK